MKKIGSNKICIAELEEAGYAKGVSVTDRLTI